MSEANKMSEIIEASVNSLKSIAGADTIIGEPIKTENGTTVVPVSKISLGFVSGGIDYTPKNSEKKNNFGGGGGTGVTMTPVCFLVIKADGDVQVLNISDPGKQFPDPVGDVIGLVERSPEIIDKFKTIFGKKKDEDEDDSEGKEE